MDSTNVSFDSIPNFPMAPTVGVVRSSPTPSSQKLLTRQAVLMDGSPYGGTLLVHASFIKLLTCSTLAFSCEPALQTPSR